MAEQLSYYDTTTKNVYCPFKDQNEPDKKSKGILEFIIISLYFYKKLCRFIPFDYNIHSHEGSLF